MIVKLVEIRDVATFIPAMAVKLGARNEYERWLLARAGFGPQYEDHQRYVILIRLHDCAAQYDPYSWRDARTMPNAHNYIEEHFDELASGDVIDVQFILKETPGPKISERGAFMRAAGEEYADAARDIQYDLERRLGVYKLCKP